MLSPSGRRHRQLPAASRISACSTSRKAGRPTERQESFPCISRASNSRGAPDAPHLQASCGHSATFLSGPPFLVFQPRIPRSESWGSEREKEKDPPNSKKGWAASAANHGGVGVVAAQSLGISHPILHVPTSAAEQQQQQQVCRSAVVLRVVLQGASSSSSRISG